MKKWPLPQAVAEYKSFIRAAIFPQSGFFVAVLPLRKVAITRCDILCVAAYLLLPRKKQTKHLLHEQKEMARLFFTKLILSTHAINNGKT